MSLYHKYRPKNLNEIIGNQDSIEALEKMISDPENCPQSILLTGPRGCGKTTIARIIAKRLGIKGADFREMDTADFRGIDMVREIRKQAQYRPLESPRRMWLLDECHKLTGDASSALLKILEDTPLHVYFVLCTTDPQKLLGTVRSRCCTFEMKPLTDEEMKKLLIQVTKAEGEKITKSLARQIIQDSLGHPRDALQILDKALRVSPEKRLEVAKQVSEQQNQSIELCRALLKMESWAKVSRILNGLKDQEPESIRRHVLGYANSVLLKSDNERAGLIMEEFIDNFYESGFNGLVLACYTVVKN